MTNSKKLLLIHLICHLCVLAELLFGSSFFYVWILSFIWWNFIAIVGISAGYHRYFSHKAFKTNKAYEIIAQTLSLFANPGPVLTWASTHRMHHAYSDTPNDPHSPKYKGFFKVYCSAWGDDVIIKRRFLKGLIDNNSIIFFYKNYFKLQFGLIITLLLLDYQLFLFAFALPVVFAFHGYGLINAYTHLGGKSKNSYLANILTAGEGWHENHHKYPGSITTSLKWYEFDITSYFIKLINEKN